MVYQVPCIQYNPARSFLLESSITSDKDTAPEIESFIYYSIQNILLWLSAARTAEKLEGTRTASRTD